MKDLYLAVVDEKNKEDFVRIQRLALVYELPEAGNDQMRWQIPIHERVRDTREYSSKAAELAQQLISKNNLGIGSLRVDTFSGLYTFGLPQKKIMLIEAAPKPAVEGFFKEYRRGIQDII